MNTIQGEPRNWKQEPMVWLLIAIPLSAVIMGVVIITLAINSYSGLVVDDYYKKGKQINRVIARDKFAYELGLAAGIRFANDGTVEVRFNPEVQFVPGDRIELSLIHATKPGLDQTLLLDKIDNYLLTGKLDLQGEGRWNLYLQSPDWRLTGSLQHPKKAVAQLLPNYTPD